ncbi:hypothetical protein ACFQZT_11115 [Paenibacillus sp. GCM10027628]|uniref:hypothetical protein n=1 Tax=Paenibacillus sp. GCM10027628 TaxID=3273413 RepID=UPI0036400962
MNRIQSVMKMHFRDKTMWIITPWYIIAASFIINLILGYMINEKESFQTGSIVSIFIYTFIIGTVTLKETFPFALGLSVRRTDYFVGTVATAVAVNAISSLALILLSVIEKATNGWGVRLHYFQLEFLKGFSLVGVLGIYLIFLLHLYFLGLAISSLHRRFGRNGMYAFFTAVFLIGIISSFLITHFQYWTYISKWFVHHYMDLFWWQIPAIVCYLIVSYALLRKAEA